MRNFIFRFVSVAFLSFAGISGAFADESNAVALVEIPRTIENTATQDTMRAFLQLQEQMHEIQLSVDRNRKETEEAATRKAEAMETRLQLIVQSMAALRTHEIETMQGQNEAMQNQNRRMLTVAAAFAGVGFLAMMFTTYFQWRSSSRFADIARQGLALSVSPARAALGAGDDQFMTRTPESIARLQAVIEQLEKRIAELESAATLAPPESGSSENGVIQLREPINFEQAEKDMRVKSLVGKGQTLLNLDKPAEAIECFDAALEAIPNHADALLKKGTALEKLNKLDEAIECYNLAIAADNSTTLAYLYKGGLCNRMERFNDALNCYEQALRSQDKIETAAG
jgi:Tetratricopeptide repeat